MILSLHIIVALLSVALASHAYLQPSTSKLRVLYGLMASTLASGIALIVMMPAYTMHACVAGIVYLAVVGCMALATRRKLVLQNTV